VVAAERAAVGTTLLGHIFVVGLKIYGGGVIELANGFAVLRE